MLSLDFFRLKLSALQEPGVFRLDIPFSAFHQTLTGRTIQFTGFYVGLSRDRDSANFAELVNFPIDKAFEMNSLLIYDLGYKEKIINTLELKAPTYYIETSYEGASEVPNTGDYGKILLHISTSLLVEV